MSSNFNAKKYPSPYCGQCGSCGESGCCSPIKCKMVKDGKYCDINLAILRSAYITIEEYLAKNPNNESLLDMWVKNDEKQLAFLREEKDEELD